MPPKTIPFSANNVPQTLPFGSESPSYSSSDIWNQIATPKPNLGDLAATQFQGSAEKIISSVKQAGDKLAQNDGSLNGTLKATGGVLEGLLGSAAGAVQGVFAPVTAVLQKVLGNSGGTPSITAPTAPSPLQPQIDAIKAWATQHPEAATNLMDAVTVGGAALGGEVGILGRTAAKMTVGEGVNTLKGATADIAGTGLNAAKTTTTGIKNAVTSPIDTAKTIIAKTIYGSDAAKITSSLKSSYDKIPLPKGVMQDQARTGKSFSDFMSQKPYLTMDVQNSKWNTFGTAQKLRQEAQPEAQALQNLLDTSSETISEQKLIDEMKLGVESVVTGQQRAGIQRWIESELPSLVDQLGGRVTIGPNGERLVSVSGANKVKQALWDRSPFEPTASKDDKLRSSVDYKMGQIIRQNIEAAVPDADVRGLNSELGDYYHSIETLENLHGGAAPGGRIGGLFTKVAGAVAGSPGGAIGSIAGYMTADKISELMMNPSITTAIKREALMQLKVTRPTVADKVAEILKQRASEQAARLRLAPSNTIYAPEYKGSFTPKDEYNFKQAAKGNLPTEQQPAYTAFTRELKKGDSLYTPPDQLPAIEMGGKVSTEPSNLPTIDYYLNILRKK